jgi:hypothetical protein
MNSKQYAPQAETRILDSRIGGLELEERSAACRLSNLTLATDEHGGPSPKSPKLSPGARKLFAETTVCRPASGRADPRCVTRERVTSGIHTHRLSTPPARLLTYRFVLALGASDDGGSNAPLLGIARSSRNTCRWHRV